MRIPAIVFLLFTRLSLALALEQKDYCYRDSCLRAVDGTRRGPDHPDMATSDCRNFMTTTAIAEPTALVFSSETLLGRLLRLCSKNLALNPSQNMQQARAQAHPVIPARALVPELRLRQSQMCAP
ncbi:hypothetical protein K432DRAFT_389079 [Lepidopterella palustris CBS 459.81]|uniref:Secreted protein n=1 Tax=Lepidopterella palustris CBS 459.81 TaxID=1314670 RepID=A0A8E2EJ35_9PEZI|nr:hypothetical protein K432DRAFT_389079 [Lepidopterella palustris CBS 459.81]